MSKIAPNVGNKALEQDFILLRSLIEQAPLFWMAVQTHSRVEQRVAEGLREAGFVAYVPMVPDIRRTGKARRAMDVSRPMFARYVFAGMKLHGLSTETIRSTKGVDRILTFRRDQQPHIIPARQMLAIAVASQEAQIGKKSVVGHGFEIGDGVVFVAGGENFFKGKIRSLNDGRGTARVSLRMLGGDRDVTVPVDKLDLA